MEMEVGVLGMEVGVEPWLILETIEKKPSPRRKRKVDHDSLAPDLNTQSWDTPGAHLLLFIATMSESNGQSLKMYGGTYGIFILAVTNTKGT